MKNSNNVLFICSNCDAQFTKWTGRCLECGKWGTIAEGQRSNVSAKGGSASGGKNQKVTSSYPPTKTIGLHDIQGKNTTRIKTGINELDRVLGGGLVPGSLIVLGGEPGIGKSTLALQLAAAIPNTLYLSAEESIEQIKLRADRLKISAPTLKLGNASNVEEIMATIQNTPLAIIDSIQTISSGEVEGEPGNVNQIRASAVKLLEAAKTTGTTVVLVSHVTKDGTITGPKTLEHVVDTVLYLEGDRHHDYRILRTVKNRFGATDEVGIFEMHAEGLKEVKNPSAQFLLERGENAPGNVLTCLVEGTRPLLVEIQALVTKTAFGYPTRKASGFDINRLHVLIAVLQKRAGLKLEQYDVHVNVVGGLEANEPAADLAVALSIASSYKDKVLGSDLVVFGEIGLSGEVRPVGQMEKRLKECELVGLKRVITNGGKKLKIINLPAGRQGYKLKIIDVVNIQELIKHTT